MHRAIVFSDRDRNEIERQLEELAAKYSLEVCGPEPTNKLTKHYHIPKGKYDVAILMLSGPRYDVRKMFRKIAANSGIPHEILESRTSRWPAQIMVPSKANGNGNGHSNGTANHVAIPAPIMDPDQVLSQMYDDLEQDYKRAVAEHDTLSGRCIELERRLSDAIDVEHDLRGQIRDLEGALAMQDIEIRELRAAIGIK
jgi:hypothetical protein